MSAETGPASDRAAPVRYEAREFLLHRYAELAHRVLERAGAAPRRTWWRRAMLALRGLVATALLAVGLLALIVALIPAASTFVAELWIPAPEQPLIAVLLAATLARLAQLSRRQGRAASGHLAVTAQRELERIRFLQTFAVESHGSAGGGGLQIGRRWSRQLLEQPLTMAPARR